MFPRYAISRGRPTLTDNNRAKWTTSYFLNQPAVAIRVTERGETVVVGPPGIFQFEFICVPLSLFGSADEKVCHGRIPDDKN